MIQIKRLTSKHLLVWLVSALVVGMPAGSATAQELLENFVVHPSPQPVAAVSFEDGQGRARSLADFKGKVVLLNIWATWCASCRYEMPSLDALQATLGSSDFEVVPLSVDRSGIHAVAKFYTEIDVRSLATYIDTSGQAVRTLGAIGLPTTLLIDPAGREIGRLTGPADWDTPEMAAFLKAIILKQRDVAGSLTQDAQVRAAQADQNAPKSWRGIHAPTWPWRGFQWLKALFIN